MAILAGRCTLAAGLVVRDKVEPVGALDANPLGGVWAKPRETRLDVAVGDADSFGEGSVVADVAEGMVGRFRGPPWMAGGAGVVQDGLGCGGGDGAADRCPVEAKGERVRRLVKQLAAGREGRGEFDNAVVGKA